MIKILEEINLYEQDYIMRLIKEMVRMILKLLFNIDTKSPSAELIEEQAEKEILNELLKLADSGRIIEAEEQIQQMVSGGNKRKLKIALIFYSYINDMTDEFLQQNDYSRDKLSLDLKALISLYGLESMAETFLEY